MLRLAAAREPPGAATPAGRVSVRKLWLGVPAVAAAFTGRGDELDALEDRAVFLVCIVPGGQWEVGGLGPGANVTAG